MFWTFVDPDRIAGGRVVVDGPAGHHLARVLRVRVGEHGVAVAAGREHQVEVVSADAGQIVATIIRDQPVRGEPTTTVELLQAVLPNPDFDAVIEAGTAVGISRFIAVHADRSVAHPAAARRTRWQSIARSAAEQSHRGQLPEVVGPMRLVDALERITAGSRLLVLDPSADLGIAALADGSSAYSLAVGPEGGWTSDELDLMAKHGGMPANLGPRILRARLAPVIAAAILVQQS